MKRKNLAVFFLFIILILTSGCNIQPENIENMTTVEDCVGRRTEKEKLDALDIPYLVIAYDSMEEQRNAFEVIGNALGQQEKAEKMNEYYESVIDNVSETVARIPEDAHLQQQNKYSHNA